MASTICGSRSGLPCLWSRSRQRSLDNDGGDPNPAAALTTFSCASLTRMVEA